MDGDVFGEGDVCWDGWAEAAEGETVEGVLIF